ncbi:MAG TPA: aspartyl protease family protein [Hyphomonadaceae bacterium]|nr:aspartyl protease family protein [Hyphomonadaceae bacterium]
MAFNILGRARRLALAVVVMAGAAGAAQADEIAFKYFGDSIFIPIKVNGHETYAMIDTGAGSSIIDPDFAKEIGLGALWKQESSGASGGKIRVDTSLGAEIAFGDTIKETRTFDMVQLDALTRGTPATAVIGIDVLKNYVISFDFDRMVASFVKPNEFKAPKDGAITMKSVGTLRAVRLKLDGKEADTVIDTGASTAVHLNVFFQQRNKVMVGRKASEQIINGVDGTYRRPIASLQTVEIGGKTFTDVPATISPRGLGGMDAILGMEILSQFNIVFDLGHYRMWLTPNSHFGRKFDRNTTGLLMKPGTNPPRIWLVAPNSPAAKAGFKEGEAVVEIRDAEGKPVGSQIDPGQTVTVVLDDGSTRQLTTENYY